MCCGCELIPVTWKASNDGLQPPTIYHEIASAAAQEPISRSRAGHKMPYFTQMLFLTNPKHQLLIISLWWHCIVIETAKQGKFSLLQPQSHWPSIYADNQRCSVPTVTIWLPPFLPVNDFQWISAVIPPHRRIAISSMSRWTRRFWAIGPGAVFAAATCGICGGFPKFRHSPPGELDVLTFITRL